MFGREVLLRAEREATRQLRRLQQQRFRATVTSVQDRTTEPGLQAQPEPSSSSSALPFEQIPGPRSLPVIGTRWLHMPGGPLHGMTFYEKVCKLRSMFGEIIREEVVPGFHLLHLYKPEDYETVYRNDGKYPVRNSFFMLQRYNKKYNDGIHGIIDSQGESWHRLRRQVQQKMLKPKAVSAYFSDQAKVADDFIDSLRQHRNKDDIIEDLLQHLYKYAAESIGVVCFNKRIGALDQTAGPNSESRQFINAVSDVLHATHTEMQSFFLFMYFDTPMFKRLVKAQNLIRSVSSRHAQDSLRRVLVASASGQEIDGEHGDLIPYMMTKTDLTEAEVMTVVTEFFFGGVDTTSHMLGFILYNLCKNPDSMGRLREEIDAILTDGRPPTDEDVSRMPYLKAVFKESLRILPVAPGNGRSSTRDLVLSGFRIPKGTVMALHHDVTGHDDQQFHEASQFRPERWLRSPENQQTVHPFIFMPFGFGARGCVGKRFAEQEVALAIVKFLQNFDIDYCHTTDLKYEMNIVNTPVTPLRFRFSDRK
ncbi:probable cytochrome P450 12a5, mitochondrial [Haliotis cracherodii]|uniref:probable cytochrome P450 12a5, mitochondrial n=1 Tax=Haliotis cracherodii TaxID=6455 RepID=UPI0039EC1A67